MKVFLVIDIDTRTDARQVRGAIHRWSVWQPNMRCVSYSRDDNTFPEFMEELGAYGPSVHMVTAQFGELGDKRCRRLLEYVYEQWQSLAQQPSTYGRKMPGVRYLELSSNHIRSFRESALTHVLQGNRLLTLLEIQANELGESGTDDICAFAHALESCSLRRLNMTANQLGDAGMAAFFDHMPHRGTSLRELRLSVNTFESDAAPHHAAHSIARFLSSPTRCRGVETIHLNGNNFGWEGVRAIVHAIIGSRRACTAAPLEGRAEEAVPADMMDACPPNRSLIHIDLFSSGIDTWTAHDAPRAAWEAYSMVTRENWHELLVQQLKANEIGRDLCQKAAAKVLAAARIIGCKSHFAESSSDAPAHFPFLRLPVELRRLILHHVDTTQSLSHNQLVNVLRWAVEPSTLKYVSLDGTLPPTDSSTATPDNVWDLPPWSWTECYTSRSPPRNWFSDSYEQDERGCDPAYSAFLECTGTVHMDHDM